jgi:hypothetical protein
MTDQLDRIISAPLFAASWFFGLLLLMEVGRRAGRYRLAQDPENAMAGLDVTAGAVLTLFGLLIAFTLAGAGTRLDARRQLIAEEANDISTAYQRLDLLPAEAQPAMRGLFRDYVDSRLAVYRYLPDVDAAHAELARSAQLQSEIWARAVAATHAASAADSDSLTLLLLPPLNTLSDIGTTRTTAARIHTPPLVYALLYIVGLVCALLAGYRTAQSKYRNWTHMLAFTLVMGVSVYVILALEYPRMNFLHLVSYDQLLVDVRESMK